MNDADPVPAADEADDGGRPGWPSRRAVVAGGLLLPFGAVMSAREAPSKPHPDIALVAAAVAREQGLLALYDRALAASPGPVLAALREEHAVHLRELRGPFPDTAAQGPPPTRAALRAAEHAASAGYVSAAGTASRQLAALFASLAAAEAAHDVALT